MNFETWEKNEQIVKLKQTGFKWTDQYMRSEASIPMRDTLVPCSFLGKVGVITYGILYRPNCERPAQIDDALIVSKGLQGSSMADCLTNKLVHLYTGGGSFASVQAFAMCGYARGAMIC